MKFLTEHAGLIASIGGLLFVAIRLTIISGGSWETASAVLQSAGSASVLLAALLALMSTFPILAANIWIAWFTYDGRKFGVLDSAICATIAFFALIMTPRILALFFLSFYALGVLMVVVLRSELDWSKHWNNVKNRLGPPRRPKWLTRRAARTQPAPSEDEGSLTPETREAQAPDPNDRKGATLQPQALREGNEGKVDAVLEDQPPVAIGPDAESLLSLLNDLREIAQDVNSNSVKKVRGIPERLEVANSKLGHIKSLELDKQIRETRTAVRILEEQSKERNAHADRMTKSGRTMLTLMATSAILLATAFTPVWLPLEKVEAHGKTYVGYVLTHSDKDLVLLQDDPRGAIRITGGWERAFCVEPDDDDDDGFFGPATDPTPVVTFLGSSRYQYPDCPDAETLKPKH